MSLDSFMLRRISFGRAGLAWIFPVSRPQPSGDQNSPGSREAESWEYRRIERKSALSSKLFAGFCRPNVSSALRLGLHSLPRVDHDHFPLTIVPSRQYLLKTTFDFELNFRRKL
jgi:hypothetical protein